MGHYVVINHGSISLINVMYNLLKCGKGFKRGLISGE